MRNSFLEILIKILVSLKLKLRFTLILLILHRKTSARLALAPLAFKGAAEVGYANGLSRILTLRVKIAYTCKQPFSIYRFAYSLIF